MSMKRIALPLMLGVALTGALAAQTLPKTNVFLVGDSTVCEFTTDAAYCYPRFGYGTKLGTYLDQSASIINLALSGRSSRSFLVESNYEILKNGLSKGDYLIIGFGHNDEKGELERYSDPNTPVTDPRSFKYSLYTNYIKLALDAGATPILCTPIVRRSPSGEYSGNAVHLTTSVDGYPGGDYAECIRQLGKEFGLTVIDATMLTKTLYEKTGIEGTLKFHAWINSKPGSVDNTHTNEYGAAMVAFEIAKALKASGNGLGKYVLPSIVSPDAAMLKVNATYIERNYTPPSEKSAQWKTTDPWQGSVFGDIGGAGKAGPSAFKIEESGSAVTLRSGPEGGAAGKIAAATDGILMYFQAVPGDADFTLTATATVVAIAKNDQVSFGLMARDDMHIDSYDSSIASQYAAAGVLRITKGPGVWCSTFARQADPGAAKNSIVATEAKKSDVPDVGTKVKLTLVKKGNEYTLTYGKEKPVTYTLDLSVVDPAQNYVGVYTVRQCEVSFSDIVLKLK